MNKMMWRNPKRLVIFDCDGVLVDSEPLTMTVLCEMLISRGAYLTPDQALLRFRGRKIAQCFRELEQEFDIELDDFFVAEFRNTCMVRYSQSLLPTPGIREVVTGLYEPHCVATSAPRPKVTQMLTHVGLFDLFEDRIFTAYEVGAWKPDPTLFEVAAAQNGVQPGNCIVVEDSAVGVAAAKAAGMNVLLFAPNRDRSRVYDPTVTEFHKMTDLPALLRDWRIRESDNERLFA